MKPRYVFYRKFTKIISRLEMIYQKPLIYSRFYNTSSKRARLFSAKASGEAPSGPTQFPRLAALSSSKVQYFLCNQDLYCSLRQSTEKITSFIFIQTLLTTKIILTVDQSNFLTMRHTDNQGHVHQFLFHTQAQRFFKYALKSSTLIPLDANRPG